MSVVKPARVLVFGSGGMLGSYLLMRFCERFRIIVPQPRNRRCGLPASVEFLRLEADASAPENILAIIEEARPDVIINCAVARRVVAEDPVQAEYGIRVNSVFPHVVASAAAALPNCYFIQISTDAVFSGRKGNYSEDDIPDPVDFYGTSKLLGEVRYGNSLTLRTSFFGISPGAGGLVDWLVRQSGKKVPGYKNYKFSGIALPVLGDVVESLVTREDKLRGLYNLGGAPISKLSLLQELAAHLNLDVFVYPACTKPVDRSLKSARLWEALGSSPPTMEAMVRRIASEFGRVA